MGSNDSEFVMHVYCKDWKECGITLLITVKQKTFYVDLNFFRQATHPTRGVLVLFKVVFDK